MDFNQFLNSAAFAGVQREVDRERPEAPVDLTRSAAVEMSRDLYVEAESRGLTLSELLECEEYDPTPNGCPLDAFERQLALAGVRLGGKSPTT
ncbi:MAG: hypothetical protein KAW61_04510, partial [candidate division Zixibacteria bacterium]|nr:hypothetical protein [candidate division Zixibacteria bacterium]